MRRIQRSDIATPFHGALGELIYEMVGRPEHLGGTTHHSLVHVVVPPGASSPAHYHAKSEESYYGLAGKGLLQVDGRMMLLERGVEVLIMPGEVHQIRNASDSEPLEFLTVSAPAWVPDDSFEAALPAVQHDDTRL